MTLVSYGFLLFFPVVVAVNFILPKKLRYIWLLVMSYVFYISIDVRYAAFLVFATLVTYIGAILIDKRKEPGDFASDKNVKAESRAARLQTSETEEAESQAALGNDRSHNSRKPILIICVVLNLAVLAVFKYANFAIGSVGDVMKLFGAENDAVPGAVNIIVPVGISFYMFQALGYLIDVYRGTIEPERNILKYALFVSFFPNILSGPIERAGHMLPQFDNPKQFDYEKMRSGLLTMLWGYFLKLVLADRIAIVVNSIFADPAMYRGTLVVIAVFLYTMQIYCDFAGYSAIAVGAGRVLGYEIMENFNCPYLADSIGDFWRRWHISLSRWLRDYIYIPLGGNRKGVIRKYVNVMIVFIISGFWHGAGWTFVIWGALHGLYQVIGRLLMPVRDFWVKIFKIDRKSLSHRILKMFVTFVLVSFAWIFFRAGSMKEAIGIIRNMSGFTPWVLADGSMYTFGIGQKSFTLMICALLVLLIKDVLNYCGISVRKVICSQGIWLRWITYIAMVVIILVCGIWGAGYNASSFIYYKF